MAILSERQSWKRPPRPRGPRVNDLTPEQRANVRRAMDILRAKHGGEWKRVARAMGISPRALLLAMRGPGKPGAGIALRAARLADVPAEDVLSGAFAKGWACPMCGRSA